MPDTSLFNVEVTRTFNAPVERVWQAWSDSELVKEWWGPTGFSCPLAKVDFREGGTTLVAMRAPKEMNLPNDFYNTWSYTKITPNERIEYTANFADENGAKQPPIMPGVPEDGHHVVTFKDLGNGTTEMYMAEHDYTVQEARDRSQEGLGQCLDKMAAAVEHEA